jgi:hypothetical protein
VAKDTVGEGVYLHVHADGEWEVSGICCMRCARVMIYIGQTISDHKGMSIFFTINRKPNRIKFSVFSVVRFRFLYLRSSVFSIVIGFHRIPNRNTKKTECQTLSILKFDYSIM